METPAILDAEFVYAAGFTRGVLFMIVLIIGTVAFYWYLCEREAQRFYEKAQERSRKQAEELNLRPKPPPEKAE